MIRSRRNLVIGLVLLFVTVAWLIAWPAYRVRSTDAAYAAVDRGMDETAVVARMGKPSLIAGAGQNLNVFWEATTLDASSAVALRRQYLYEIHSLLSDGQWSIGFDAAGKVIAKHRYE